MVPAVTYSYLIQTDRDERQMLTFITIALRITEIANIATLWNLQTGIRYIFGI